MSLLVETGLKTRTGLAVPSVTPTTVSDLLTEGGDHLDTEADEPLVTESST